MLAVQCPQCGRPSPVSLSSPDIMVCAACHFRGPPPPAASQSLRAAAHILFHADVRRRQFSDSMRRSLASASRERTRFLIVFIIASLPISLFSAFILLGVAVSRDSEGNAFLGGIIAMAWLTTLASGALGVVLLNRRQRRIEERCAAHPPAAPGEPATCHMCGAPLAGGGTAASGGAAAGGETAAGGGAAIARCGFCGADNLVSPHILDRARARQAITLQSFEQAVGAELASFGRAVSGASGAFMASAVAIPISMLVLALIALIIAESRRMPVDPAVRYAVVGTPLGQCIGKLHQREDGSAEVRFSAWRPEGLPTEQAIAPGTPIEILAAEAFIGRTVTTKDGKVGKIEEVFSSPLMGNSAMVRHSASLTLSHSIAGLCFDPRPDAPSK